eukprot:1218702-Amphidinium_carterae.1
MSLRALFIPNRLLYGTFEEIFGNFKRNFRQVTLEKFRVQNLVTILVLRADYANSLYLQTCRKGHDVRIQEHDIALVAALETVESQNMRWIDL